jgi:hypothetical protein
VGQWSCVCLVWSQAYNVRGCNVTDSDVAGQGLTAVADTVAHVVALHAECCCSSSRTDMVGAGKTVALLVGSAFSALSVAVTFLASTSVTASFCYSAGLQPYSKVCKLLAASPSPPVCR